MNNMTLGELIATLKRKKQELPVYYMFGYFKPTAIHSYRGYYDQLALGYSKEDINVAEVITLLKNSIGVVFTGYKGGNYKMTENTPMWVSNVGEATGDAIIDVIDNGWCIYIKTERQ